MPLRGEERLCSPGTFSTQLGTVKYSTFCACETKDLKDYSSYGFSCRRYSKYDVLTSLDLASYSIYGRPTCEQRPELLREGQTSSTYPTNACMRKLNILLH